MMSKSKQVPIWSALAAAFVVVAGVLFCGCEKEPQKEAVYPAEGHAYVHDPEFKAALSAQRAERYAIARERDSIVAELDRMVASSGGDRAAVTNSPAGAALIKRLAAVKVNDDANRAKTISIVRDRVNRAKKDSERIKNGEAVSKISKQEEKK